MQHNRIFRALLLGILALVLAVQPALAAGPIDTDVPCALTIEYKHQTTPLRGADFRLYRVGDISWNGEYSLTGPYADLHIDVESMETAEDWSGLLTTLTAYAAAETPDYTGETDREGRWTVENLPQGLYLLVGLRHHQGGYTYTAKPALIGAPLRDADDNWQYVFAANAKYERILDDDDEETIIRKALKVWDDEGMEDMRPEAVEVVLLRDGETYDTVKLSAENNWKYTWRGLSADCDWQIIETPLEGYSIRIEQSGEKVIITNTAELEEPVVPDEPDEPTEPVEPEQPDQPEQPAEPQLPVTGMLQWPVPVLALLGLILIAAGWALRRKAEEHD